MIVDGVEEVANFAASDIEPTPDFGGAVDAQFITGMAKSGTVVKTLIDLDKISAVDGTIAIQALGPSHPSQAK